MHIGLFELHVVLTFVRFLWLTNLFGQQERRYTALEPVVSELMEIFIVQVTKIKEMGK